MRVQKEGPCDSLDTSIGETWAIGGQAAHIFINESDSCTLDPLTITVLGRGGKWHNLLHTIIEEILNCETALRINIHQSVGVSYQWAVDKNNTKLQKEQVYDLLSTPHWGYLDPWEYKQHAKCTGQSESCVIQRTSITLRIPWDVEVHTAYKSNEQSTSAASWSLKVTEEAWRTCYDWLDYHNRGNFRLWKCIEHTSTVVLKCHLPKGYWH